MLKDNFLISFKNLRQRKLRSWLTMIGIFIGIAAVVSLIGLGEGLRAGIMSQFDFLGTDILTVQASGLAFGPPGTGVITPLSDDLVDKISKVNGVETAYNRYLESSTVKFNDKQIIGMIASVPIGDNRKTFEEMLNVEAEEGRLLKDTDNKRVLVGSSYTSDATFGRVIKPSDRIELNGVSFEVVGIMEKKGNFMLDGAFIINENVLLDVFGDDDVVDIIAVKIRDEKQIDQVKENIEKLLRKERDVKKGEENFQVESAQNLINTLNSTLAAVNIFVVIIASISLLVGGIGIMNTMYTSVLERTKEIGIMKAIGARNSRIFKLFFIESGFLGMVGGIIGVILGLIFAYGSAFLGRLALGVDLIQARVPLFWIIFALLLSFGLGTLFGVIPAINASKLQPVDALRSK